MAGNGGDAPRSDWVGLIAPEQETTHQGWGGGSGPGDGQRSVVVEFQQGHPGVGTSGVGMVLVENLLS